MCELGSNEVVDFVIKRLQIAPMLMTEWRLGGRELETEKKALFVLGLLVRESFASPALTWSRKSSASLLLLV